MVRPDLAGRLTNKGRARMHRRGMWTRRFETRSGDPARSSHGFRDILHSPAGEESRRGTREEGA